MKITSTILQVKQNGVLEMHVKKITALSEDGLGNTSEAGDNVLISLLYLKSLYYFIITNILEKCLFSANKKSNY